MQQRYRTDAISFRTAKKMGMDRKLAKNRRPLMIKLGLVAVFGSSLAYAGLRMLQDSSVATFRVGLTTRAVNDTQLVQIRRR